MILLGSGGPFGAFSSTEIRGMRRGVISGGIIRRKRKELEEALISINLDLIGLL